LPQLGTMRLIGGSGVSGRWANLITWILAAIAILVPVAFWFLDADRRSIDLRIVSVANLDPSLPDGFQGDVDISLSGAMLQRPHFVVLEVMNAGNQTIRSADVEVPLTIDAGRASIAKVQVMNAHPASVKPKIDIFQGKAVLAPLLLNPGDSFQIGVLTSGAIPEISTDARIAGVGDVRLVDYEQGRIHVPDTAKVVVCMFLLSMYMALFLSFLSSIRRPRLFDRLPHFRIGNAAQVPMALCCGVASIVISAESESPGFNWTLSKGLVAAGIILFATFVARLLVTRAD